MEFSSAALQPGYDLYISKLSKLYCAYLDQSGDDFLKFIASTEACFLQLKQGLAASKVLEDRIKAHHTFKQELLRLLDDRSMVIPPMHREVFRLAYLAGYESIIEQLPEITDANHLVPKYDVQWREHPLKTLRKIGSNVQRSIKIAGRRFANFFRSLFRLKPLTLDVSKMRRIPLRAMMSEHCSVVIPQHHRATTGLLMQLMSRTMTAIWDLEEQVDVCFQNELITEGNAKDTLAQVNDAIVSVAGVKTDFSTEIESLIQQVSVLEKQAFEQLDYQAGRVDTPELSFRYLSPRRTQRISRRISRKQLAEWTGWEMTHGALLDDWSVDVEIALLYYSLYHQFTLLVEQLQNYVHVMQSELFDKINETIKGAQKSLSVPLNSRTKVADLIVSQQQMLTSTLTELLLPELVDKLTGCFDSHYENFHTTFIALTNKISTQRAFIRKKDYLHIARSSEIKYISPRNLLEFAALPAFVKRIEEARLHSDRVLERSRSSLVGMGSVCDFSLESALIKQADFPEDTPAAVGVAVEGLERAAAQLRKVTNAMHELPRKVEVDIRQGVIQFNREIQKLKNNDNIFSLHIEIARIQAMERARVFGRQLIVGAKIAYPLLRKNILLIVNTLRSKIKNFKQRIGIVVERKIVSFELSEFIEYTNSTLERLPFVYQRLFRLEPTGEDRFFVGRQTELDQLKSALNNWEKDRYITVALIGEKGNGTTSLLNYFLKHYVSNWQILRYTLHRKIYVREDYFDLMSEIFGLEGVKSNDDIIDGIICSEVNRIVVLENLQHLFLKQVNGFDVMNLFFEVMANTMKKVLWIGSFTTHSWNYLDKTIHVSNYFTNEISIQPMSRELIEEVIYRRNVLSGYHIVFEELPADKLNKKFRNADAAGRQEMLRRRFFMMLRQLSSGNVSLAQMYWLRSVQLVNDEEINIKSIHEFDGTFLAALSNEELFALQALVIHDGLMLEDFARVMRKPVTATRNLLIPMFEKGFLIKPGVKYNINPIIFKSVCQLLTSRNFISPIK